MGRLLLLMLVVGVVLVSCSSDVDALKCYWCVGTHCLHAGSGERIDCDGSCYTMSAELPDGRPGVIRSCSEVHRTECDISESGIVKKCYCNTDLCNTHE